MLKWVASRSNLDVTRDDAAQATIWVNIIQKLQIVHGFNQDMEWHPHHTELLRLMSVTSGIRSGTLVEMEGEHDD